MASLCECGFLLTPGVVAIPDTRGAWSNASAGALISRQLLSTDQLGTHNLTLTNIVVGSVVYVQVQSTGALIYTTTAGSSTIAVTLPVYATGQLGNYTRIKVRKGASSPTYQPYETLLTVYIGSSTIFVSQQPDE